MTSQGMVTRDTGCLPGSGVTGSFFLARVTVFVFIVYRDVDILLIIYHTFILMSRLVTVLKAKSLVILSLHHPLT